MHVILCRRKTGTVNLQTNITSLIGGSLETGIVVPSIAKTNIIRVSGPSVCSRAMAAAVRVTNDFDRARVARAAHSGLPFAGPFSNSSHGSPSSSGRAVTDRALLKRWK